MKKIALEEHFLCPEVLEYWEPTIDGVPTEVANRLRAQLLDFDEQRLSEMDDAQIEFAILSIAGPGVQAETDVQKAVRLSQAANDALAAQMQKRPTRYGGFGHLAMQDPKAAADELERCVRQLGMQGAMIDGATFGQYLDEPQFHVFWERAEALGAPIYLHPADPEQTLGALRGHPKLRRATWEWGVETATHALRLVFAGTFERFPGAKLILGHLGETLPYLLWRFDSRVTMMYGLSAEMRMLPSAYIKRNIVITNSGMCSMEPTRCAIDALGEDSVMFSVDYPFESTKVAHEFIENADLTDDLREKLCHGNAKRLFGL